MKGPRISIAADPLLSAAYCGVDAGMVILVADDPGPITTQTEQDSRWFASLAKFPMVDRVVLKRLGLHVEGLAAF